MQKITPIYQLKRQARMLARSQNIPLHQALDTIAKRNGYERWSLLSTQYQQMPPTKMLPFELSAGDMALLGARPGEGKTRAGLELLIEAVRQGRSAVFFTLYLNESEARDALMAVAENRLSAANEVEIMTSDDIGEQFIASHLATLGRGTIGVIDYLQLLDRRCTERSLREQMRSLQNFVALSGTILMFLSQIDRSFDASKGLVPQFTDIPLSGSLDLSVFSKVYFMHNGVSTMTTEI